MPPKSTLAPVTKLVPVMFKVKPAVPTSLLLGERFDKAGTGLLTVKSMELDAATPGLITVIGNTPAVCN